MREPRRRHDADVDGWGIQASWVDAHGTSRQAPAEVVAALRVAIGRPPADLEANAPIVTRPGRDLGLGDVTVVCEDGAVRHIGGGSLPGDFPLGYHTIRRPEGAGRSLIVSPGRCWLPDGLRTWGWVVQLYAARSRRSWGIGDLADLKALREWSQEIGAGFLLVNPLHAVSPALRQENSPYLPSTRRFRNPIYLDVEELAAGQTVDIGDLSLHGRAMNDRNVIDRDEVWRLKREALWRVYSVNGGDDDVDSWRQRQGEPLEQFAVWCALAAAHGPDWHDWDPDLHDPTGDAVRRFAADHETDVAFYAWLQWHLERQLLDACGDFTILQDLPVGVSAGGADGWVWQDLFASDVTIGAPPDIFNQAGQDWGSPPLTPWRLRTAGYRPFVDAIRATMAPAGGLRIDHVMGLFRLWWVAPGGTPVDGSYVRYPSEDLLDIVALESHRHRALVIGEDLGTVDPGVREVLADRNMLSYRLLYFEDEAPASWPVQSLAAVTTHDLPTVAGLWTGSDSADLREHTAASGAEADHGRRALVAHLGAPGELATDATATQAVETAYRRLATASSMLVCATLEDATGVERRPNIPASTHRDNWCLPLPLPVDDLAAHEPARRLARILRRVNPT